MPIRNEQIVEEPKTLAAQVNPPATGSGRGVFYAKDIGGGQTEGYYVDEAGNEVQITNGGALALPPGSGEANTASSLGSGEAVFAQKSGVDLQFKSLVAGTNVTLTSDGTSITINASGGSGSGEENTASNLGAGSQVFAQKSGVDLQFRTLVEGANISLNQTANTIEISSTASGGATNEYLIELSADSGIANKIANGTIPTGINAVAGDNPLVDSSLNGTASDLVLIHDEAKPFGVANVIRQAAPFFTGFQTTNFGIGDIKTDASLNQVIFVDYETVVGTNASKVFLKLV